MIEEIEIRDLGVIEHALLAPGPGFTAITGETGAGKTMLLTAVDLLIGGKADPALVRTGATDALVDGRFVGVNETAREIASLAGADLDDGALVVARTVAAAGRSRAHLGGRGATQAVLAELGTQLVTVHGQSDQVRLRSGRRQREIVDAFAGAEQVAALEAMKDAHRRLADLQRRVTEARASARTRDLEIASLTSALSEIEAAKIEPGEDEELRREADRLDNIDDLAQAVIAARASLGGDEEGVGVLGLLDRARRALGRVADHDPALGALGAQIEEQAVVLGDLEAELSAQHAAMEADPARLEQVHARRAELSALGRSYGMAWGEEPESAPAGSSDAVLAWARGARGRLEELNGPGFDVAALEAELAQATARRDNCAEVVRANRTRAGKELAKAVSAELHRLAMPKARIDVTLKPIEPTTHGADDVAIALSAHDGAPFRPLGEGASGVNCLASCWRWKSLWRNAPRSSLLPPSFSTKWTPG